MRPSWGLPVLLLPPDARVRARACVASSIPSESCRFLTYVLFSWFHATVMKVLVGHHFQASLICFLVSDENSPVKRSDRVNLAHSLWGAGETPPQSHCPVAQA